MCSRNTSCSTNRVGLHETSLNSVRNMIQEEGLDLNTKESSMTHRMAHNPLWINEIHSKITSETFFCTINKRNKNILMVFWHNKSIYYDINI